MHYGNREINSAAEDLDHGVKRAVLTLAKGDTAEAVSDRWVLAGPGEVEYLMGATGWTVNPSDTVTKQYI
jgi:hypothetical protein